jgi:hypothetical protein
MGISTWWNGFSRPKDRSEVDRLEALAEAAYARMYGAKDRCEVRTCWEEASQHFFEAIEAARRLNLPGDVQRLTARKCHCHAVWHSQFRGA